MPMCDVCSNHHYRNWWKSGKERTSNDRMHNDRST